MPGGPLASQDSSPVENTQLNASVLSIACSGKFHAFALAEQLERHGLLNRLYTAFAQPVNTLARRFVSRIDKEQIPVEKFATLVPVAAMMRAGVPPHLYNEVFDRWVAARLKDEAGFQMFVGWSGMSLRAIGKAKALGRLAVVDRGSSHILHQERILHEEYQRFGIDFGIHPKTKAVELAEYEEADFISIPSLFVKRSFLEYGIAEEKLVMNPYGVSSFFKRDESVWQPQGNQPLRILYVGSLLIRKGLIYLFEALKKLPPKSYEAWFIGKVDSEMKSTVDKYAQDNWKFFGHVNHYDLARHISACDVAVHPSLQEGLSMVIPQVLTCGVPMIATTNSGGEDVIEEGKTGFIIPIRDPEAIAQRIQQLNEDRKLLESMKTAAAQTTAQDHSWNAYGDRWATWVHTQLKV